VGWGLDGKTSCRDLKRKIFLDFLSLGSLKIKKPSENTSGALTGGPRERDPLGLKEGS